MEVIDSNFYQIIGWRLKLDFYESSLEVAKIMHISGNPEVFQVKLRVSGWRSVGCRLYTE